MNRHTIYKHNGLNTLINSNNRNDIEMYSDLNIGDASRLIGLIKIHTFYQCNESS